MILTFVVVLVVAVTLFFTLTVRAKDLPPPDPVSPTQYLEDRKAQIYENLRDLQFEYRVGKLSDEDYQQTKVGLQQELAGVLGEIEKAMSQVPAGQAMAAAVPEKPKPVKAPSNVCPHCNAQFPNPMKFCGECGKAMA
jgi:hypothetical protein